MKTYDDGKDRELFKACVLVERWCRSIGKDCQLIFTANGVEIAPLADPGSSVGETLFEAIREAEAHKNR